MRIPCRCNRRQCQARRSLRKRPELYARWPRCECGGKLYVDEYRLRRGPHDPAPLCRLDCLPYPHSVTSRQCVRHEDYVLALKPSKHRPFKNEECQF